MTPEKDHRHGHRDRLRARLLKAGRESFADYELLELLLTYAIPRKDTKALAKRLVERFGSFAAVLDQTRERLLEVEGIGSQTVSMAINPQSFFNFAAQNYSLLHDIFRRIGGMNDAELSELIRRHRAGLESPAALIEKLLNLKIIEPLPRRNCQLRDDNSKTLRKMVEEVLQLKPEDTPYLLGDYIDRGPDSNTNAIVAGLLPISSCV